MLSGALHLTVPPLTRTCQTNGARSWYGTACKLAKYTYATMVGRTFRYRGRTHVDEVVLHRDAAHACSCTSRQAELETRVEDAYSLAPVAALWRVRPSVGIVYTQGWLPPHL